MASSISNLGGFYHCTIAFNLGQPGFCSAPVRGESQQNLRQTIGATGNRDESVSES